MIVGVGGAAQHGKDTVAQVLVEDFGFTRMGFADALKDLALLVNPYIYPEIRLSVSVEYAGWEEAKTYPEVRRILQDLGVGARDVLGPDVWVTALERVIYDGPDNGNDIVISDVRFPNEADFIHAQGGQLWKVIRLGFDNGIGRAHVSEQYIDSLPEDVELLNAGTLEQFKVLVREAASRHLATGYE